MLFLKVFLFTCFFSKLIFACGDFWSASKTDVTEIIQNGITFKLNGAHHVGQFVNGDYWIVGPLKVISNHSMFVCGVFI